MKRYAIVIEDARTNLAAYAPDLPGCIATGKSVHEVVRRMKAAIELHIEGMIEEGLPIPTPTSRIGYVKIDT